MNYKIILTGLFFILSTFIQAQANSLEASPEKEKKFTPYMLIRHQGTEGLAAFKAQHHYDYLKELWYYSESFYIKRNYRPEGISMDEAQIDISRFESQRKENEETLLLLPGFKDALVLLPGNKLIYKP